MKDHLNASTIKMIDEVYANICNVLTLFYGINKKLPCAQFGNRSIVNSMVGTKPTFICLESIVQIGTPIMGKNGLEH